MKVHKVLYQGGAQTLSTIPIDERGKPIYVTSGTYTIEDIRHGETSSERSIGSGSFTTDAINDTLSAAAGPSENNDRLIQVADVTSYSEGITYLLDGLSGRELFEVESKDSTNNYLYARNPLSNDYAQTTTAVRSVEIKCTFPSAEASDESAFDDKGGPYLVVWNFTAGGKQYIVAEQVFVVRYDERPMISETEIWLAYPGLKARAQTKVHDAIKVATDDFLAEVEAAGKNPAYFRASRAGAIAIRNRTVEYLLRWQQTPEDNERADLWEERYQKMVGNLLTGIPDHGTVEIHPTEADASPGTSKQSGFTIINRA